MRVVGWTMVGACLLSAGCGSDAAPGPSGQSATAAGASVAPTEAPLLTDESFEVRSTVGLEHWQTLPGAGSGSPTSYIGPTEGGGVLLEGRSETKRWDMLTQEFAVEAGAWYRLDVQAEAEAVAREAGQFDNRWVGVVFFGPRGRKRSEVLAWLAPGGPAEQTLYARAPDDVKKAEVRIFLSETGKLVVRHVHLTKLAAPDSLEILVSDMGRHYSHFADKGVDWPALVERHRARLTAAREPAAFAEAAGEMLAELHDVHVTVGAPGAEPRATWLPEPTPNVDRDVLAARVSDIQRFGSLGWTGKLGPYGYVAFTTLTGSDVEVAALEKAVVALRDAAGVVVELRGNTGGDERVARRIVAHLADAEHVYAKSVVRAGPLPGDFGPEQERKFGPPAGESFSKPIAVLTGPLCMSSCEAMAMMLRASPHASSFGQATGGASGNPQPLLLPNGVTVAYSRWVALLPDGTPIEGKGIAPHTTVEHVAGKDPTLDAALAFLDGKRKR